MNVFEFLGLPANHRTTNKVVQLVKHYNEVPDSKKTWPMYGQIKKDGVYATHVVTSNKSGLFSRTGKRYTNVDYLEYNGMEDASPGVYIAELCNDECSLETLSGLVNPNRVKDITDEQEILISKNYLAYHDYISLEDFIKGKCDITYYVRYNTLQQILPISSYIIKTYQLPDKEHKDKFVKQCIDDGEEGAVLKQLEEGWVAGHKGYRMMKEVRGVDYDLECIRAEEGKGKYKGLVANLFFKWKNGKEIKCMLGKGWTHEDAREMWNDYLFQNHYKDEYVFTGERSGPIGKIFQVYALQESSKGKLRIPKVGERRIDKDEPDI